MIYIYVLRITVLDIRDIKLIILKNMSVARSYYENKKTELVYNNTSGIRGWLHFYLKITLNCKQVKCK
jgi:hypothetical protein